MAKNFKELQAKMPREARVRSEEAAKRMISEMGLAELREAMDLTQESLADTLHVKQASISKMERRSDMYIGTLSKIIEAMVAIDTSFYISSSVASYRQSVLVYLGKTWERTPYCEV